MKRIISRVAVAAVAVLALAGGIAVAQPPQADAGVWCTGPTYAPTPVLSPYGVMAATPGCNDGIANYYVTETCVQVLATYLGVTQWIVAADPSGTWCNNVGTDATIDFANLDGCGRPEHRSLLYRSRVYINGPAHYSTERQFVC